MFLPGQQADIPRYFLRRGQFVVSLSVLFIVQEGAQNKKGTLEGHRMSCGTWAVWLALRPLTTSMLKATPFAYHGPG
jgi:hypothetical protein